MTGYLAFFVALQRPPDAEVRPAPLPGTTYLYLPLVLKNHAAPSPPTPTPPVTGDAYEPDGTCGQATPLAEPQSHTFDPAGDEDWVAVAMTAGHSYAVQTGGLQGGADTILQLYAPDCVVLLAENDDYGGELWSRIEWAASETATYYARVRNYDPTVGGEEVGYSISVQQLP